MAASFKRLLSRRLYSMTPRHPAVAVVPLSGVRFPRPTAARAYSSDDGHRGQSPYYQNGEYPVGPGVERPSQNKRREVWEGYENEVGLYLRFDMPGVGKEDVKVRFEKDKLVMQGVGDKYFEDRESRPGYNYSIQLLEVHLFDTSAVKADIVKGVLKVFVPKLRSSSDHDKKTIIKVT